TCVHRAATPCVHRAAAPRVHRSPTASAREREVVEPEVDADTGVRVRRRELELETETLAHVEWHLGAPPRLTKVGKVDRDLLPIATDAGGNVFRIVVITLRRARTAAAAVAPL